MAESKDTLYQQFEGLSLKDRVKPDQAEGNTEEKAPKEAEDIKQKTEKDKVQGKGAKEQQEEDSEVIVWNAKRLVFFDLETTGLDEDCDIVQISARHGSREFDQYVFPTKRISPHASQVNCLKVKDGELHYKESRVVSVEAKEAMESFVNFLEEAGDQLVLVAHNGHRFDVPRLLRVMDSVGVRLPSNVDGFLDSMVLAKTCFPGRKSYSQPNLVSDFLKVTYEAHNAAADVKALQSLMGVMLRDRGDSEQDVWGKCFLKANERS